MANLHTCILGGGNVTFTTRLSYSYTFVVRSACLRNMSLDLPKMNYV